MVSLCKILLGVASVAVVTILIVVPTVVFLNDNGKGEDQRFFSLDDVFNNSLKPKSYNMRWISDTEYLHKANGSVYLHNPSTSENTLFLSTEIFQEFKAYDYQLSADRKYVALMSNYTKLWRHSFTATYSLYDLAKKQVVSVNHQVQFFAWSPQGHKLAYVWNNDVYVKTSPEVPSERVTYNGKENEIFNGVPDWVYEEEMFSSHQGLWWSPGGAFVAYAHFNDSLVPHIEYTWFGDGQYPKTVSIPYPKAGATNPTVKLFVVDVNNVTKISEVMVPAAYASSEHYLATVTWATDERIAVQWQKRVQSHVLLQIYNQSGGSWEPFEGLEISSSTGWVGRFSPSEPVFAADKTTYYLIMSDKNKYKHIHRVRGGVVEPVTSGKWEVVSILLVNEDSVYYVSNEYEGKPGGRNVYRYTWSGGADSKSCLTCHPDCLYNSVYLSSNGSSYRLSCNGPGIPQHSLVTKGVTKSLEDNTEFANLISTIQMPTVKRATIKIDGFDLWYQMVLPPGFAESKKYPLLIDVYAGPCSQKVDYLYRVNWATYLASTEKIIVASFDGRGSGYQGDEIMHKLYQRLGTYEVEDQITAAKEFIKMGFIDKDRVAIWGWSYGGYVTSMALGAGSGVFKCGMAVAPVSKWKFYDSIYTERYMNPPHMNQDAYNNSTVTARAKNFHSVEYLLVHGTADDNVHFQQAAEISEALVEEQVDFDSMWYTDKDHGLGGAAYQHVYTHMSHFLLRCFA
ncbi:dipeptidyl peptidase 4-like [Periophthalmus magnuspinnatus]|uniref:dipeptidyl peptidase 4-like n=1 Tax=Periophthalmus magnuspinnatus TaxID=409849 RepID=UPI00145AA1F2|nr:dipeptidyl peptidase 4-like [Periophthalmus magnuspinnatus]